MSGEQLKCVLNNLVKVNLTEAKWVTTFMSLITFFISFLSGRGSLNVFMTFSMNVTWQHGIKLANPNTLLNQILVIVSKCEVLKRTMNDKKKKTIGV